MIDNLYRLSGASAIHAEKFTLMTLEVTKEPGGGWIQNWKDGVDFEGALANDTSIEARAAEAQTGLSRFTLAVPVGLPLYFQNYIKRKFDGLTYKVASDPGDVKTHPDFPVQEKQMTVEKSTLPA